MVGRVGETTPLMKASRNDSDQENSVEKNSLVQSPSPERSFASKFLESVIIIVAYSTQGAIGALTGPTLPDLQLLTDSNTDAVSQVITGDYAGQLVSCAVVAFVLARFGYNLILFLTITIMAVMVAVIPWCPTVSSMITVFVVRGFCGGFVNIGLNAAMVWIWGLNNGPYMQALHLSFSIGALCSPLFASQFLATTITDGRNRLNATHVQANNESIIIPVYSNMSTELPQHEYSNSRIFIPYTVVAVLTFLCAMLFLIRLVVLKQILSSRHLDEHTSSSSGEMHTKWFYLSRMGPSVYIFLHSLVLSGFAGFLSLFVVQYLKWSATDGALLSTVFWAGLSIGRGIAVFGLNVWSPSKIMIFSSMISLIFFLVLSLLDPLTNSIVWASAFLIGLGIGPLAPGDLSWYTHHVAMVTSLMATILLGSSALGGVAGPIILGYLFNDVSPMWFCYLLGGVHILSLILFVLLCIASLILNSGHHNYVHMPEKMLEYETVVSEDTTAKRQ